MKDLDLAIVVLAQGTKRSCISKKRRGCRDVVEKADQMLSRRYLGAIPSQALRISWTLYSMQAA